VATADPDEFSSLAQLPFQAATCSFGIGAMVYSTPTLIPLVLLAVALKSALSFVQSFMQTSVMPIFFKGKVGPVLAAFTEEYECRTEMRAMQRQGSFDHVMKCSAMQLQYVSRLFIGCQGAQQICNVVYEVIFAVAAISAVVHCKSTGGSLAHAMILFKVIQKCGAQITMLTKNWFDYTKNVAGYRRINDFIGTKQQEGDDGTDAPKNWPSKGAISIQNVNFRYVPHGPLALHGVSIEIKGGEKVGVCGPTGSGKSTLLKLLFRLGPLEGVAPSSGGCVVVDGVDISTLKLHALRKAIAVVPQDPVVFKVSVHRLESFTT
jgi:ABC-type multidrug transport system fused ATPase/permease subunit